jgi:hypothetical protein
MDEQLHKLLKAIKDAGFGYNISTYSYHPKWVISITKSHEGQSIIASVESRYLLEGIQEAYTKARRLAGQGLPQLSAPIDGEATEVN